MSTARKRSTSSAARSVPMLVRSKDAAAGSVASARRSASASNTVRLPSRRSSPEGLPVTSGSPNTPSRSSRSWKATPMSVPKVR
ncbi:Uncharacterised protein [Mycobacteroides abscessus subsp. abscessus]|nr:Uncharacterised protein [Mycobacteroides abscessus subsp. abscessus]